MTANTDMEAVRERFISSLFQPSPPTPWVLAVSGGSDSMALLHLAAQEASERAILLPICVTIDHGLRPEAIREAERVKMWCDALNIEHHILSLQDVPQNTNVQAAARTARYKALGEFCLKRKLSSVLTGHTQDDQAETFLMRINRGSGLDGLSCMAPSAPLPLVDPKYSSVRLYRPLLTTSRAELRTILEEKGQEWIDDPSNQDTSFERVRVRNALQREGLDAGELARSAMELRAVRDTLDLLVERFLGQDIRFHDAGYATIDSEAFLSSPEELSLRALRKVLMIVGGRTYGPNRDSLLRLMNNVRQHEGERENWGATLSECEITWSQRNRDLLISREFKRSGREAYSGCSECSISVGGRAFWDNRFELVLEGPDDLLEQFQIKFLATDASKVSLLHSQGQLAADASRRWEGLPKRVRPSLAALYREDELLLVPYLSATPIIPEQGEERAELHLSASFRSNRFFPGP